MAGKIIIVIRFLFWAAVFLFGVWALAQQSQGVVYDSIVVGCIIVFTAFIILCVLSYERYIRRLRKKTHGRHKLVRLWNATERWKEFQCICSTGGKIYLGLQWAIWVNSLFYSFIVVVSLWNLLAGEVVFTAALMGVCCGIALWNYFAMRQDMFRHEHSSACSRKAAYLGVLYMMPQNGHTIRDAKRKP